MGSQRVGHDWATNTNSYYKPGKALDTWDTSVKKTKIPNLGAQIQWNFEEKTKNSWVGMSLLNGIFFPTYFSFLIKKEKWALGELLSTLEINLFPRQRSEIDGISKPVSCRLLFKKLKFNVCKKPTWGRHPRLGVFLWLRWKWSERWKDFYNDLPCFRRKVFLKKNYF